MLPSAQRVKRKLSPEINLVWFFVFAVLGLLLGTGIATLLFNPSPCANSVSCISNLSGESTTETRGTFLNEPVAVPPIPKPTPTPEGVLGDTDPNNKHIYVDLTNQMLYAKEGDKQIYAFQISSGKWGKTPTGDFRIWIKLRATRMTGGSKALHTYYDLPNVPYTMYFYNDKVPKYKGYGIHGAYWHNNFGHPMSHGCINLRPDDAMTLYQWATPTGDTHTIKPTDDNPGTAITIYGEAPAT